MSEGQPPQKKQRTAGNAPEQEPSPAAPVLHTARLFQVAAGLPWHPSPGAMHACRVAALAPTALAGQPTYSSLFATGPAVYWSSVALPPGTAQPDAGKEGVLLPARVQADAAVHLKQLQHGAEVQSLAVSEVDGETVLATADCYGRGVLARLQLQHGQPAVVASLQRIKPAGGPREGGWAGVVFNPARPAVTALARGFARDIQLFDAGVHVRSFGMHLHPYALRFLPIAHGAASDLLAVAEAHTVSLWDARASEAGGLVERLSIGGPGSAVHCLDWCAAQGGLLGAAGVERSVFMIDPRKWRTLTKWTGAARQAIHQIAFLESDPSFCCVSGLDQEVTCARWGKPPSSARPFPNGTDEAGAAPAPAPPTPDVVAYRGDARWLGVAKAAGADVLAGLAASGNVVYADLQLTGQQHTQDGE